MLGACSISIVYPFYPLVFFGVIQLPEIFPYFGKYPGSMICRCNSVPRHPWDRSLCFESERLHKLHMRSSAASPAEGVLGFLGSFGGRNFNDGLMGLAWFTQLPHRWGNTKVVWNLRYPAEASMNFPNNFQANGSPMSEEKLLLIQIIWLDIQKMFFTSFRKIVKQFFCGGYYLLWSKNPHCTWLTIQMQTTTREALKFRGSCSYASKRCRVIWRNWQTLAVAVIALCAIFWRGIQRLAQVTHPDLVPSNNKYHQVTLWKIRNSYKFSI